MKKVIADKLKSLNLPNFGNRKHNKTHPLCVCSATKKEHFNNALNHPFKSGETKNKSS